MRRSKGGKVMKCMECQKRPATLHLTQVINGQKTERHVCEICAQQKGYVTNQEDSYSLHDLITGLFGADHLEIQHAQRMNQEEEIKCDQCQMSFHMFRKVGRFGCANCYETFKSKLDPIFRRIHSGSLEHQGKIPKRQGGKLHLEKELAVYRSELNQLIEAEEFEEAAVIRDKIRVIEDKKDGDHS